MDNNSSYRVSLRVLHPEVSANQIVETFSLPVKFARSVGNRRATPKGTLLNGFYKTTDVSFCFSEGVVNFEERELVVFLREKLSALPLEYIDQLSRTEGEVFFTIGVFSSESILIDLLPSFLQDMAAVGMGMRFDFYGGPD